MSGEEEPFGFLNVLKPCGMTSHDVVSAVRRAVGTRRVGHSGTLDPAAAGVLAVAVGRATRLIPYLSGDKAYMAEIVFGVATDSADAEGNLIDLADASGLTREAVLAAMDRFRGTIRQRPPMASAVHVNGRRLYELARAGEVLPEEAIPEREVRILAFGLREFEPGRQAIARVTVACSAGTYIRSLAVDLGRALGLPACLGFLVRTRAGDFTLAETQTLEELAAGPRFIDLARVLGHLPAVQLDERGDQDIGFGRVVACGEATGTVRLYGLGGGLVAVGEAAEGRCQPTLVFVRA